MPLTVPQSSVGDDDVLRRVHELVRQVARVRRLEGGVGQTLARAVGGDEVLHDGQALAEVRRDGLLDDLARRLGHQTAHARELLELLAVAARAGIDGHEHRVDFLAALVVFEGAEEHVGDFVTGVGPDVDDLVVTLAVRDDAAAALLVDLADLLVGALQFDLLLARDDHVEDADGNARAGRLGEAEFLQAVQRLDGPLPGRKSGRS